MTPYIIILIVMVAIIVGAAVIMTYAPFMQDTSTELFIGRYQTVTTTGESVKCIEIGDKFHTEEDKVILDSVRVELTRGDKGSIDEKWVDNNFDTFALDFAKQYDADYINLFI